MDSSKVGSNWCLGLFFLLLLLFLFPVVEVVRWGQFCEDVRSKIFTRNFNLHRNPYRKRQRCWATKSSWYLVFLGRSAKNLDFRGRLQGANLSNQRKTHQAQTFQHINCWASGVGWGGWFETVLMIASLSQDFTKWKRICFASPSQNLSPFLTTYLLITRLFCYNSQ